MSFQIPDLDALERMPDREVRFYAIVGVLMSLTGAMERLEFQTFHKGLGASEDLAGTVFYKVRNDAARAQMARAAMDHRMAADAQNSAAWTALTKRLDDATATTSRNLVSHNPAIREMRPDNMMLLMALWNHVPEGIVRQDPLQVRYNNKAEAQADFHRLRKACEHLFPLHQDLEVFLDALP